MQKVLKLFVYPLSLLLLLSSQGLHIHVHYCNTTNTFTYGINQRADCDHEHLKIQKTCCSSTTENLCIIKSKHNPSCCSDTHFFVQTIDELRNYVSFNEFFFLFTSLIFEKSINILCTNDSYSFLNKGTDSSPPPIPGTFLVILYQNLKIPTA